MVNKIQKNKIPIVDFSKFRGKDLAIIDGKIIAEGESSKEVLEKAEKLFPQKATKDITLLSVPKERIFIYLC